MCLLVDEPRALPWAGMTDAVGVENPRRLIHAVGVENPPPLRRRQKPTAARPILQAEGLPHTSPGQRRGFIGSTDSRQAKGLPHRKTARKDRRTPKSWRRLERAVNPHP